MRCSAAALMLRPLCLLTHLKHMCFQFSSIIKHAPVNDRRYESERRSGREHAGTAAKLQSINGKWQSPRIGGWLRFVVMRRLREWLPRGATKRLSAMPAINAQTESKSNNNNKYSPAS